MMPLENCPNLLLGCNTSVAEESTTPAALASADEQGESGESSESGESDDETDDYDGGEQGESGE
jgi:hypothetical protein